MNEEENPLYFVPHKTCSTFNKSGRPKNENLIKFSPQPRSLISQMLKKINREKALEKEEKNKSQCEDSTIQMDGVDDREFDVSVDNNDDGIMDSEYNINEKPVVVKISKRNKNQLYTCDYPKCIYITKLSSNLIKHKRTHTREKPYLCDQCSFRSNFVNSLKVHKRIHTNERPYVCKHCPYRCNSSSNLKKHCKHKHWNET